MENKVTLKNPQHTKNKCEHYTPIEIIYATRELFGGQIDLDVASDAIANRVVKASRYYTQQDNALTKQWKAENIFCNPPGSTKDYHGSLSTDFWDKLYYEYGMNTFGEALFVGYSIEILCKRGYQIMGLPFCVPQPGTSVTSGMGRIMFDAVIDGKRQQQRSPTHGNVIVYLPDADNDKRKNFYRLFSQFGKVMNCD